MWYVDASAGEGGNGSPSRPFRTIGRAFAVARSADTIRIADGVYVGPENRDLDFAGRQMVVESLHGPSACVIDLEHQAARSSCPRARTATR